jgi:hypothetical protein
MTSTMRFDKWETTLGTHPSEATELAPAYAQINKIAGVTFGSGHQNIAWDEIVNNKNITLSSNQISFAYTGIYNLNVGMRIGSTSSDVWTGVNVYHPETDTIIARSYGTGNVVNDPGPFHFSLLVNITQANSPYQIRLYRAGGTMVQATPDVQAGRAIVATIYKIG